MRTEEDGTAEMRATIASLRRVNEALREEAAVRESRESRLQAQHARTCVELAAEVAENGRLRAHLQAIEARSEECLEMVHRNANLISLYVASHRLHASLERHEVLEAIQEVIGNLVGSEEVAVFERHGSLLHLVFSRGIDPAPYVTVAVGSGPIGAAVSTGELYVAEEGRLAAAAVTACIPLAGGSTVSGAIAIFGLLPQKRRLEPFDLELLDSLALHAGSALYAATLHARVVQREAAS